MRGPGLITLGLFGFLIAGVLSAGEPLEYRLGFSAGIGTDSNPVRVSGDGPSGTYTDLRLSGGLSKNLSAKVEFFLGGALRSRDFSSDASNGDDRRADLTTGLAFSPVRNLNLAFGGLYKQRRMNYVDRETGLVYQVPEDPESFPGATVAVDDRLNHDSTGLFADARWRIHRRVRLSLETTLRNTDYSNDYSANTDLDRLDYRELTIEPGARIVLNEIVTLDLSVRHSDTDYDARPALDKAGSEVPGTRREYRDLDLLASLRIRPSDLWRIRVGVRGGGVDDTYAGYYDNSSLWTFASADRTIGPKGEASVYASFGDVEYDTATVSGLAGDEVRSSEVRRLVGRYTHELPRRVSWFTEVGIQRNDSMDPVYAYDRDWMITGIKFERRSGANQAN